MRQRSEPSVLHPASNDHDRRLWSQCPAEFKERAASGYVEHQVVTRGERGEVLLCVVDNVVRSQRSDDVHILRAAHAGNLGSEMLGELNRKGADTTGRAVDQD